MDTTFVDWGSTYEWVDENAVGELRDPIYQAVSERSLDNLITLDIIIVLRYH